MASHPSMLLLGNFFLHMTVLSDSRPPFRTKREGEERGAESNTEMSGDLVSGGADMMLLSFKQRKAASLKHLDKIKSKVYR